MLRRDHAVAAADRVRRSGEGEGGRASEQAPTCGRADVQRRSEVDSNALRAPDSRRLTPLPQHVSTSTRSTPLLTDRHGHLPTTPVARVAGSAFHHRGRCVSIRRRDHARTAGIRAAGGVRREGILPRRVPLPHPVLRHRRCATASGRAASSRSAASLRELIANETRVIVLLGVGPAARRARRARARVRRRLQRWCWPRIRRAAFRSCAAGAAPPSRSSISSGAATGDDGAPLAQHVVADAAQAAADGRRSSRTLGSSTSRSSWPAACACTSWCSSSRAGGIASPTARRLSFMDDAMLTAVLQPGQAEWAGLAARRDTLDAVRAALRGGVHAVNLCTLEGLARELYTYEGSGTLFTLRGLLPHRAARHRRLRGGRAPDRARPARGVPEAALAGRDGAHPAQRLRRGDRLAPLRRRLRARRPTPYRDGTRRRDRRPLHDHPFQGRGRRRAADRARARGGARRSACATSSPARIDDRARRRSSSARASVA